MIVSRECRARVYWDEAEIATQSLSREVTQGGTSDEIFPVLNWTEELTRLVPTN